jgi:hypothetical protein
MIPAIVQSISQAIARSFIPASITRRRDTERLTLFVADRDGFVFNKRVSSLDYGVFLVAPFIY